MSPYLYSVYGHNLASNVPLPLLAPAQSSRIDISFAWKPPKLCSPTRVNWIHHWRLPDGTAWLFSAQAGKDYLLRLRQSADFWLSRNAREVRGIPLRILSPEMLEHLLVNHILPFALAAKGWRVLHASASRLGQKAVVFLGEAGAGKSTLAGLLLARGYPALADDCALVGGPRGTPWVLPSSPALRLWPEMKQAIFGASAPSFLLSGKETLQLNELENFHEGTPILSHIYVLAPDEASAAPATELLPGPRALVELVRHSYRLDPLDRAVLARQLEGFSDLVEAVRVKRLIFAPSLNSLGRAADLVLSEMAQ